MEPEQAFERARRKLVELREGRVRVARMPLIDASLATSLATMGFLGVTMAAVAAAAIAGAMQPMPNPGLQQVQVPLIGGASLMASLLFGFCVAMVLRQGSRTPRHALRNFYEHVAQGDYIKAAQLIVPNEFDASLRDLPEAKGLGEPLILTLADVQSLYAYWEGMIRFERTPFVTAQISNLEVRPHASDFCSVQFDLRLVMRPTPAHSAKIQLLSMLVDWFGLAPRADFSARMWKLLYHSPAGWRLFNAEFMGREESDKSWVVK